MNKKYRSKVDLWYILVDLAVIAMMVMTLYVARDLRPLGVAILGVIYLAETYLLLHTLFSTYYVFQDEYFDIHAGPMHIKLKYSDIEFVKYATNYYSSAALSKDKIEIREKNKGYLLGTICISPKEKEEVYNMLLEKIKDNK